MEQSTKERLAALEQKVHILEVESAAMQIALVTLIATHHDHTKAQLALTRALESVPRQPGKGPLQFLTPKQRDEVKDLVEWWGTVPAEKPQQTTVQIPPTSV